MGAEGQEASNGVDWGERIRWIIDRYDEGNRSAAARRLNLSAEAVNNLYSGKSRPSGDTLAAILRAYPKVSPEWLVQGTGPRERPREDHTTYSHGKLEMAERIFAFASEAVREARDELGAEGDG